MTTSMIRKTLAYVLLTGSMLVNSHSCAGGPVAAAVQEPTARLGIFKHNDVGPDERAALETRLKLIKGVWKYPHVTETWSGQESLAIATQTVDDSEIAKIQLSGFKESTDDNLRMRVILTVIAERLTPKRMSGKVDAMTAFDFLRMGCEPITIEETKGLSFKSRALRFFDNRTIPFDIGFLELPNNHVLQDENVRKIIELFVLLNFENYHENLKKALCNLQEPSKSKSLENFRDKHQEILKDALVVLQGKFP
jgi:hypothetical protein